MQKTWVRSLDQKHTHSSILAWRIPWTEKSGGPQSKGSQRATQLHKTEETQHTQIDTCICMAESLLLFT